MIKIKNNLYQAEISTRAAEVYVFKKSDDDYNYVWSGDPNYWSGHNPTLFPQVSGNSEKTIKINGVKYPINNHGFARNLEYTVDDLKEDEVTLSISDNEETMSHYPFKFKLETNYHLVENKLVIKYTITNNDDKVMPFGFGLHPAFACKHNYEDTKVIFNKDENSCGKQLIINKELFEKYPNYIIDNPKATSATLVTGDRQLTIEYIGYKIFCIWSKGDFVCLEPWMNHCPEDPEIELKDRPGTQFINPHESSIFICTWSIDK